MTDGVRIDQLPATLTPDLTYVFPAMKGGETNKLTLQQVKDMMGLSADFALKDLSNTTGERSLYGALVTTGGNFNSYVTNGIWEVHGTALNPPAAGSIPWLLTVDAWAGGAYVRQIAIPKNNLISDAGTGTYFRFRQNNAWTAWYTSNPLEQEQRNKYDIGSQEKGVGCYMALTSATNVAISPAGDRRVWINGVSYPYSVVTNISNSGFGAYGLRHVYAYWNGAAIAFELSTTGPQDIWGIGSGLYKTGDSTRRYIGIIACGGAGTFRDDQQCRSIANYHFRRRKSLITSVSGSTASTTLAALAGAIEWIQWPDDQALVMLNGYMETNAVAHVFTAIKVDAGVEQSTQGNTLNAGEVGAAGAVRSAVFGTFGMHGAIAYARVVNVATCTITAYMSTEVWI